MRFRIHRIVVLVRIIGIGNFARQFLRHRIVAARIVRLDRRGAHDHFRAQRLQQIHFFLGLLVGDGENHFVAAHRRDQRQPHPGISGSAFDDRAAGLEQSFFLGVVDHGDADAVFHRAARIDVVGLDVNLRLQALVDAIQAHQRRVADGFQNVVTLHNAPLPRGHTRHSRFRCRHNLFSLACAHQPQRNRPRSDSNRQTTPHVTAPSNQASNLSNVKLR